MKRYRDEFKAKITNNLSLKFLNNDKQIITELEISIPGKPIEMNQIPQTVHTLRFNYNFENLPSSIPSNITSVYFYEFSDKIEELPNTIENIDIHKGFNHSVDKLHNNLKYLNFGWNFNQPIDNLPTSLEKIILGQYFTHSINNLPPNIKFVYIGNPNYSHTSISKLPKSMIFLQLATDKDFDLDFNSEINDNYNYICQLEKNNSISTSNSFTNALFLKNYYFVKKFNFNNIVNIS